MFANYTSSLSRYLASLDPDLASSTGNLGASKAGYDPAKLDTALPPHIAIGNMQRKAGHCPSRAAAPNSSNEHIWLSTLRGIGSYPVP